MVTEKYFKSETDTTAKFLEKVTKESKKEGLLTVRRRCMFISRSSLNICYYQTNYMPYLMVGLLQKRMRLETH